MQKFKYTQNTFISPVISLNCLTYFLKIDETTLFSLEEGYFRMNIESQLFAISLVIYRRNKWKSKRDKLEK